MTFWDILPWALLVVALVVMRTLNDDNRLLRRDNLLLRKIAKDAEAALERLSEFGDMTITPDHELARKLGLDKKSPLP